MEWLLKLYFLNTMNYQEKLSTIFVNKTNMTSEGFETISVKNQGATINEVESLNRDYLSKLPNDYIEFLKNCNGCTLYDVDGQYGFIFFGTNQIEQETEGFKEVYENEWDESIVLFCSVMGSGDFLGFRLLSDSYEIIDCYHEDNPKDWAVISTSFSDFMNKLIDSKGSSFWLEGNNNSLDD